MLIALSIFGYLIVSAVATRLVVWRALDIDENDDLTEQTFSAVMGLFWPMYIAMACVCLPLVGLGWVVTNLGKITQIKLPKLSRWFMKR